MATGYDARGAARYDRFTKNAPGASEQSRIGFARRLADFGRLRDSKALNFVHTMGSDFYAGLKWAEQYQKELCPKGWNQNQRPGMIFSNGLCVQDYPGKAPKADAVFRILSASLAGGTVAITVAGPSVRVNELSEDQSGGIQSQANFFAPFVKPVGDLKSQLPTRFSACGNSENVGDPTLGGILPKGDGVVIAGELGWIGKPCQ
jgi:hypothetical protein